MERYFFDVRNGSEISEDEEGTLLTDAAAAIKFAKASLSVIVINSLSDGGGIEDVSIDVRANRSPIGNVKLIFSVDMASEN